MVAAVAVAVWVVVGVGSGGGVVVVVCAARGEDADADADAPAAKLPPDEYLCSAALARARRECPASDTACELEVDAPLAEISWFSCSEMCAPKLSSDESEMSFPCGQKSAVHATRSSSASSPEGPESTFTITESHTTKAHKHTSTSRDLPPIPRRTTRNDDGGKIYKRRAEGRSRGGT